MLIGDIADQRAALDLAETAVPQRLEIDRQCADVLCRVIDEQRVDIKPAVERVDARVDIERIVAVAAVQNIVVAGSIERIGTCQGIDLVGGTGAEQIINFVRSGNEIIPNCAVGDSRGGIPCRLKV